MKKFLLLLAFCLGMAAASSCVKESTFVYNNYMDFVVSHEGTLVSDIGVIFRVVENKTGSEAWRQEGSRFYILCDIQNREMDIILKNVLEVRQLEASPLGEMEKEYADPIIVNDSSVSGLYFNIFYTYYYNPASNYAHNTQVWWDSRDNQLNLYLYHDGNGENPAEMDADLLKEKQDVLSIPLTEIRKNGEFSRLSVTVYELSSDSKEVTKNTYNLTN